MITYRLTDADIVAGNTLWRKYHVKDATIIVAFLAVGAIIAFYLHGILERSVVEAAIGGLILSACIVFGVLWLGQNASRRKTLYYFRTGPEAAHGELSVEWGPDHVTFRQAENINKLRWSDFQRWSDDETILVLLGTGPIFYAMPKRAFSVEQLHDFHSHLETAGLAAARRSVLAF